MELTEKKRATHTMQGEHLMDYKEGQASLSGRVSWSAKGRPEGHVELEVIGGDENDVRIAHPFSAPADAEEILFSVPAVYEGLWAFYVRNRTSSKSLPYAFSATIA